jgi:hypothetical protein
VLIANFGLFSLDFILYIPKKMRLIFLILLVLTELITFSVNAKNADPGKAKSFFDAFKDVFLHNFDKETLTNDLIHVAKG